MPLVCGWYRFEWRLAQDPQGVHAIYLPGINAHAQVFVNGSLVGATGDLMARVPDSWERSQAFAIPVALPVREGRSERVRRLGQRGEAQLPPDRPVVGGE